ncbi:MAG: holo-ACP synthase [Actinomycetota bacterium]|nr:holo-ACP synthase [Actinomycetota bacterium]
MKHGPIALTDRNTVVVGVMPRDLVYEKILGNIQEAKARRLLCFQVTTEGNQELRNYVDYSFGIPKISQELSGILTVVPPCSCILTILPKKLGRDCGPAQESGQKRYCGVTVDIYGVGTDIIEVERVAKAIRDTRSFAARVFTPQEISYCRSKGKEMWQSFVRFAAKEAVAKALGTGLGSRLSFWHIEILGPDKPVVAISGRGALLLKQLEIKKVEVSISATRDYAVAFAVSIKQ